MLPFRTPFSHLKVWTSGTSLRLCPLILWTSFAAALIIFSTLFSCSCSSWVWVINTKGGERVEKKKLSDVTPGVRWLTCFSACLRRSRKRSSSWTQKGSSLRPCCRACSSCAFSSRSTWSSCDSRACRVRDTCRSSSRSREVRRRLSRPLICSGGWWMTEMLVIEPLEELSRKLEGFGWSPFSFACCVSPRRSWRRETSWRVWRSRCHCGLSGDTGRRSTNLDGDICCRCQAEGAPHTLHMYWLWGPGEKVLERMIVLPLMKGFCWWMSGRRSFGRTAELWRYGSTGSMLVSLLTW